MESTTGWRRGELAGDKVSHGGGGRNDTYRTRFQTTLGVFSGPACQPVLSRMFSHERPTVWRVSSLASTLSVNLLQPTANTTRC